ncbi:MAG: inositol 2-dehydrogenase, partial [Chloroflexi bacterium]
MSPIRIGIIGAGRIGKVHAESIAYRIPAAKITAVCDVNLTAAHDLANRLSIPVVSDNYKEIVNRPDVDAVLVCSSTDTHADVIKAAAAARKHIFTEKPIDLSLARIDEVLRAVEQAGVKFQVGFNRRFDPTFARVRKAIQGGEIGETHLLHIISRDPAPPPAEYVAVSGGIFLDMMIHD